MTQLQDIGNLDFDVEVTPPLTMVHAHLENFEGEAYDGYGLARCRKDDHFDVEVGADIAGGRALQDLGRALEAKALSLSITERQHETNQFAELVADGARAIQGVFEDIGRVIRARG